MRSWKLLLEVGNPSASAPAEPSESPQETGNREAAWKVLADARQKLVVAMEAGEPSTIEAINNWLGGGIAIMSKLTGEPEVVLGDRLSKEIPSIASQKQTPVQSSFVQFQEVERTRPLPPPGAPKPVDMNTLTTEERERLGLPPVENESTPS